MESRIKNNQSLHQNLKAIQFNWIETNKKWPGEKGEKRPFLQNMARQIIKTAEGSCQQQYNWTYSNPFCYTDLTYYVL